MYDDNDVKGISRINSWWWWSLWCMPWHRRC